MGDRKRASLLRSKQSWHPCSLQCPGTHPPGCRRGGRTAGRAQSGIGAAAALRRGGTALARGRVGCKQAALLLPPAHMAPCIAS